MSEIHIFLFSFFPPNRSDKEWQLCTTEGPTPVFKRFGGKGRAIDGRNIYFLFSYFFSKHEWHLWFTAAILENGEYNVMESIAIHIVSCHMYRD